MKFADDPEKVSFRVFLELRASAQLLGQLSHLQLLHLVNGSIPPGTDEFRLAFLRRVQEQVIFLLFFHLLFLFVNASP